MSRRAFGGPRGWHERGDDEMRGDLHPVMSRRLSRRDFLRYSALVGGAGVMAACRRDITQDAAPPPPSPALSLEDEPGILNVYEWAGYELKPLWRDFARRFPDREPRFSFYTDTEEALAKVGAGFRPDIVHPEFSYIRDYLNLGVVQPWDTSLLSHFPDLNPALVKAGQVDGKQYSVPLDWGFSSVLYRSDEVDPGEGSYALLFDDRYPGKISWFDGNWILVIAGYIHGFEDPWDMTDEELEVVKEYVLSKKHLVRNLWVSATDMYQDVINGNVWITYAWPDALVATRAEGVQTEYLFPKEGVISWVEGLMLFAETENYLHAHEYLDAWASPETGLWLINNYAYGHSNTKVDLAKADPQLVEIFHLDDPSFLEEPNSHIDSWIPRRALYERIWSEIKAA